MRRKSKRFPGHKTISIVVDGETEIWYLQMLKKYEKLTDVTIKPELPKKKRIDEFYEMVLENRLDFDHVIWIVDLDVILKEERELKSGSQSLLNRFKQYLKEIASYDNVDIVINSPCLEFWFLQHIKFSAKFFPACSSISKEFKNTILDGYEKKLKYYQQNHNDIYTRLRPFLNHAIQNSKKLGEFDMSSVQTGKTEMFKLFEFLGIDLN